MEITHKIKLTYAIVSLILLIFGLITNTYMLELIGGTMFGIGYIMILGNIYYEYRQKKKELHMIMNMNPIFLKYNSAYMLRKFK